MRRFITVISLLTMVGSLVLSSGVAEAHSLESNNGYTAVMHTEPDDDPVAGQPVTFNFLIGKDGASFNQNDFTITVDISSGNKHLQHQVVEPKSFGNAGDGIAQYTFPKGATYNLDLRGQRKTDPADQFHMTFEAQVKDATLAGTGAGSNGPAVLLLGAGSLALLVIIGFIVIRQGRRYAAKKRT